MENITITQKSQINDYKTVRNLQKNLYNKAKQEKEIQFINLYENILSPYLLREAYRRIKENKGAAGIDGKTFDIIKKEGKEHFLEEIRTELETKTYIPSPLRRVYIEKENGKIRDLGIPTIKDRVIQMSCKMIIEPIFEADFEECSFGYRPKHSTRGAIKAIKKYLENGEDSIYDADLCAYFDTIPHDKLLTLVEKRIGDEDILHLIKMWLETPIMENGKLIECKNNKIGIPQGAVISPLLANIYLNLIDKTINHPKNIFSKAGVKIIRYADDFVLIGKKIPEICITKLKKILTRMGLKINEEKTRLIQAKEKSLEFLGFSIRYDEDGNKSNSNPPYSGANRFEKNKFPIHYDKNGNQKTHWIIKPAKKSIHKITERLKKYITREIYKRSASLSNSNIKNFIRKINMKIEQSIHYFTISGVCSTKEARQKIQYYVMKKLNALYKKTNKKGSNFINQNIDMGKNSVDKAMNICQKDEVAISTKDNNVKDTYEK